MPGEGLLHIGDRLRISGGYDMNPPWLSDASFHEGTLVAFMPGQNGQSSALVELDTPLRVAELEGKYLILELRYVGAKWVATETVHLELCDFHPEAAPWKDRRRGKWIESHATYKRL